MKPASKITLLGIGGLLAVSCVLFFFCRSHELPRDSRKPPVTGTATSPTRRAEKSTGAGSPASEEAEKVGGAAPPGEVRVAVAGRVVEEGSERPIPGARVGAEDRFVLTTLQGGDPGWGWRSTAGNRGVHFDRSLGFDSKDLTARVKTHTGNYRIRAEVTPLFELPRDLVYPPARPVLTEEIEVTVPESGEAVLRLKLPIERG